LVHEVQADGFIARPIADGWRLLYVRALAMVIILLMCGAASFAYSVLTHEEIVDLLWTGQIQPLLLKRYPGLSDIHPPHTKVFAGGTVRKNSV
jgi:hypothetical protein